MVGVNTETPNRVVGLDCVVRAHCWCLLCTYFPIELLISPLGVYLLLVHAVVSMYCTSIAQFSSIGPISDGMHLLSCMLEFNASFLG